MSQQPTPIRVKTPEGNVVAHETVVDPTPQEVKVVTGDKLIQLQSLGRDAPDFLAAYLPNTPSPGLKDYDRAFRAWQLTASPEHSNEEVVQILGGYLGNKCIADFDMEWVTVTDQYGTDFAVRSKKVETIAFPFSTVLKRVEDKEYDFLHGVYFAIKDTIDSGKPKRREADESK